MDTILNAAKAVVGMAAPWIAKGLTAAAGAVGADVTAVQIDGATATVLSFVIALLVYFTPNKAKAG